MSKALERLRGKISNMTAGRWWLSEQDGAYCTGEPGVDAMQIGYTDLGSANDDAVLELVNMRLVLLGVVEATLVWERAKRAAARTRHEFHLCPNENTRRDVDAYDRCEIDSYARYRRAVDALEIMS